MKLNIPEIGTKFRLLEDWSFDLFHETRNSDLQHALGYDDFESLPRHPTYQKVEFQGYVLPDWKEGEPFHTYSEIQNHPMYWKFQGYFGKAGVRYCPVTFPAGTVLSVDRIYIRKGNEEYSSVTFYIKSTPLELSWEKNAKKRFWAKLYDVNRIDMEFVD